MPAELAFVTPPPVVWRVERPQPPLWFSRISPLDAGRDRAGNRFDIPGAGVLYAATDPTGAYAETLAGFRPSASVRSVLAGREDDPGFPAVGTVPVEWLLNRRLRSLRIGDPLPFVDVEAPETHTYLTAHAPSVLLEHGLSHLDVAAIRGPSRLLTRAVAGWIYQQSTPEGIPLYGGIRYVSRLGDYECWAVFDGTSVSAIDDLPLSPFDGDLGAVCARFGISLPS